jgi:hypothetical protein
VIARIAIPELSLDLRLEPGLHDIGIAIDEVLPADDGAGVALAPGLAG